MPLRFNNDLTQAVVRELLDYDPATGVLTWRHRARKWFPEPNSYILWNAAHAGKPAFNTRTADGYLRGGICNRSYLAHRVIWLWMLGHWSVELDHKNRRRRDNRWANLHEVTHSQNQRNQTLRRHSKTGFVGVRQYKNGYRAWVGVNGQAHFLGTFKTKLEAAAARVAANKQYGFAPGHGRARLDERTVHDQA